MSSSGSEDPSPIPARDRSPIASRRSAAADRQRRRKAKRDRRSPSYLSLRERDRIRYRGCDREEVGRRSRSRSRSRSPSPSPSRARRYFDDQVERRSRSPVRRRRARSGSYRDEEEPDTRSLSPSPSPRRGRAPRSCRSRSRTRSEECEDRLCCHRSRSRSPAAEDDFYVRIDRSDDLFKCACCLELLSSPVYECVDGHVTCAVCHGSTNEVEGEEGDDRCPRCGSTDYRRSHAVAGWLRSIWFPCDNHGYGCPAFLLRHKLDAHERSCHYAPVFCPVDRRCDFPGGPTDALERHVTAVHGWAVVDARYGQPVHVRVRPGAARSLLRAEDGALFYLCAKQADHGGAASLSMIRIRPDDAPAATFMYEVKTPAEAPGMLHRIHMHSMVWGTSLRDGVLYANPVSVKVTGSMLPQEGPQQDSVEVRIVKLAQPTAAAGVRDTSN